MAVTDFAWSRLYRPGGVFYTEAAKALLPPSTWGFPGQTYWAQAQAPGAGERPSGWGDETPNDFRRDLSQEEIEMFGSAVPRPKPVLTELLEVEREQYSALAKELGVPTQEIAMEELKSFLRVRTGSVYDNTEVDAFLQKEMQKLPHSANGWRKVWAWFPLRSSDAQAIPQLPSFPAHGHFRPELYSRKVPIEALYLMRDIEQKFPQQFNFYVSDYWTAPKQVPDPFLCAKAAGRADLYLVVFHWDEPNFKVKRA